MFNNLIIAYAFSDDKGPTELAVLRSKTKFFRKLPTLPTGQHIYVDVYNSEKNETKRVYEFNTTLDEHLDWLKHGEQIEKAIDKVWTGYW